MRQFTQMLFFYLNAFFYFLYLVTLTEKSSNFVENIVMTTRIKLCQGTSRRRSRTAEQVKDF